MHYTKTIAHLFNVMTTSHLPELPNFLGATYLIPLGLPERVLDSLEKDLDEKLALEVATVDHGHLDKKMRNCKVAPLPIDQWVAGVLAHAVREANRVFFQYDINTWADQIQYTVYEGRGSHYTWHCDTRESSQVRDEIRKLSISVLLSSPTDYEGGELQFHAVKQMVTHKPERGMAIIFPSNCPHRVRPLKSGIRKSLVGWMGGPSWR